MNDEEMWQTLGRLAAGDHTVDVGKGQFAVAMGMARLLHVVNAADWRSFSKPPPDPSKTSW